MASIAAPNVTVGSVLNFSLVGNAGTATFSEPTIVVAPTSAGTVTLQPSVQGASGAFTTAGVFTPAAGYTGAVTLSADVLGVDDSDASFEVVRVPAPETVAFDSTAFTVTATGVGGAIVPAGVTATAV